MADVKHEKLDRIREDIKRDKAKVAKLQEQIKVKEAKLKEAEASQIVADVGAMNMTPEQLGEFLALIQSGNLNELLSGKTKVVKAKNKKPAKNSGVDPDADYNEDEEDYLGSIPEDEDDDIEIPEIDGDDDIEDEDEWRKNNG